MRNRFNEQLFEMTGRCKRSKAASLPKARVWYMANNGVIVSRLLVKKNEATSVTESRYQ